MTSREPTPECPRPGTLRIHDPILAKPEAMLMRGDTMLANNEAMVYDPGVFLEQAGAILAAFRPILMQAREV